MIRVGFIFGFNNQWIGGINYYRSLFSAIMVLPERKIHPVIITSTHSDLLFLKDFPDIDIIRTKMLDKGSILSWIRIWIKKIFSDDLLIIRFLKKNHIDVLSHSNYIFHDSTIPTIGWIPDFQHKYLPEYFGDNDITSRDRAFKDICCYSSRVIFSSVTAKRDAERYYPEYSSRYEVLHFVPAPIDLAEIPDNGVLQKKYPVKEPYFFVPNQFWAHKNHIIILEALKILRSQNKVVNVLCSGDTHDYRKPKYFDSLIDTATKLGVADNFKVLGVIPYHELIGLMVNSVSVINPSLFEGWSTTVEETKSLGIPIILSDIPVHREQNPDKGIFFDPEDAESLAEIMWNMITSNDISERDSQIISANKRCIQQRFEFGKKYEKIILNLTSSGES